MTRRAMLVVLATVSVAALAGCRSDGRELRDPVFPPPATTTTTIAPPTLAPGLPAGTG